MEISEFRTVFLLMDMVFIFSGLTYGTIAVVFFRKNEYFISFVAIGMGIIMAMMSMWISFGGFI